MAFKFTWPSFSEEFVDQAKQLLTSALNKSNKPANIVDHITVKELNMGTKPPDLEILEVGELAVDKFRGIFKLTYSGDAHLVLQTKVQANPMNNNKSDVSTYTRRGILAADKPLVVPMLLQLSNLKLRGIIVLVVSKQKGVTLVFKNDPLEKVDVTSTFDSITSIKGFLQNEIEKRLRTMFQEDLPTIVHQLSIQKWFCQEKTHKESRQRLSDLGSPSFLPANGQYDIASIPDLRNNTPPLSPHTGSPSTASPESSYYAEDGYSMMGDLESLDGFTQPTYSNFGEVFDKHKAKGLKALSQEKDEHRREDCERPRVFHRQVLTSKPRRRDSMPTWMPSTKSLQHPVPRLRCARVLNVSQPSYPLILTGECRNSTVTSALSSSGSSARSDQLVTAANLKRHDQCEGRPVSLSYDMCARSAYNDESVYTADPYDLSDEFASSMVYDQMEQQEIVLQPSETSVAAQLAALMKSNHTISPYTRTLQHLTFRSCPQTVSTKPLCRRKTTNGGKPVVRRRSVKVPGLSKIFGQFRASKGVDEDRDSYSSDDELASAGEDETAENIKRYDNSDCERDSGLAVSSKVQVHSSI